MKKLIIFALCIAMGGALFAQSKSELKEQLDALTAQVETLKSDLNNSIQKRNQLQSTITLLEEKIAAMNTTINMQNTTLASYADQVARLNNEIANLTNLVVGDSSRHESASQNYPRERIVIFSNSENNTFTVPEGKTWRLRGHSLAWGGGKYKDVSDYVYITRWNSQKIETEVGRADFFTVIPENTTIKLQVKCNDNSSPSDAKGFIIIQEWDNE